MARSRFLTLTATATLLGAAACSLDNSNGPNAFLSDMAFSSAPAGLDLVSSSYASSSENGMPWGGPERGRGGGPGMGSFMGGGLGDAFIGNAAPGRGPHGGPFGIRIDDSCVFSAGTGDLTCGPTVKNGLTVTSIYTIKNAAGTAQSAIDSVTTNSIRVRTTVTGTATRSRDGSVTATVSASDNRVQGDLLLRTHRRRHHDRSRDPGVGHRADLPDRRHRDSPHEGDHDDRRIELHQGTSRSAHVRRLGDRQAADHGQRHDEELHRRASARSPQLLVILMDGANGAIIRD